MNFASIKSAFGQVVQSASSSARDFGASVTGTPKALREYSLQGQTATGGLNECWKIFSAKAKKEGVAHPAVSIWILDKRSMMEVGASPAEIEAAAETARRDAAGLTRLKHPAVVKVVESLEETRTQLVLVTEPIFASAADLLARFATLPPAVADARQDTRLSELEIKAGLLQVADGLHFLHTEANQVHRALCPHTVFITTMGAWKLGGLSLSCPAFITAETTGVVPVSYRDASMARFMRYQQPPLAYVAPELANADGQTATSSITTAADIFSLAAFAYEVLAGKPLLQVEYDLEDYNGRLASLHQAPMDGAPMSLRPTFQAMLAQSPSLRPPAISFTAAGYFQEDMLLRAVRFLDTMIQRDNLQKAAFLKDMGSIWPRVDARVVKFRMLPPLLAEARTEALQPVLLPLVLAMLEQQTDQDFAEVFFPQMASLCNSAKGDALLLLTRNADVFAARLPRDPVTRVIVPLLCRAADQGEPRCQEEMLKRVPKVAERADLSVVETDLVPRINQLCLATTNAGVRVAAFSGLAALAGRLPKDHALRSLSTIHKVTAVDRSPGTVSGCLVLGSALAHQWGAELAAEKVLPVLTPLLTSPSLSPGHFAAALQTVKQLLDSIEVARSAELDELPAVTRQSRAAAMSTPPTSSPSASAASAPQTVVGQRRTSSFGNPGSASSGNPDASSSSNPVSAAPMRSSGTAGIGRPPAMASGRNVPSTSGGSGGTTGLPSWIGAPVNPSGPQLGSKQPGSSAGATLPAMKPIGAGSLSAGSSGGGLEGWAAGGGASFGSGGASRGGAMASGAGSAFSAIGDPLDWIGPPGTVAGVASAASNDDDLFKDPTWNDPQLDLGPGLSSFTPHTSGGLGFPAAAAPLSAGTGSTNAQLDDIFGGPPQPKQAMAAPLAPKLAPPPRGLQPVPFAQKPPLQPTSPATQDSLI